MKTNLDKMFKLDTNLEKEGVIYNLGDGLTFQLRRYGGANEARLVQATTKYIKPHASLLQHNKMPPEEVQVVMIKTFVDVCLVTWTGVLDEDGKDIPCTPDNALKLFLRLPELYNTLYSYAASKDSYREDLGNC